jgi:branched-chain amino acid transport system ATP-binding protein
MSGQITFNGEDLRKLTPPERARRGIAHVPDGRGLFFGLTVAEHFRSRPSCASTRRSPGAA